MPMLVDHQLPTPTDVFILHDNVQNKYPHQIKIHVYKFNYKQIDGKFLDRDIFTQQPFTHQHTHKNSPAKAVGTQQQSKHYDFATDCTSEGWSLDKWLQITQISFNQQVFVINRLYLILYPIYYTYLFLKNRVNYCTVEIIFTEISDKNIPLKIEKTNETPFL